MIGGSAHGFNGLLDFFFKNFNQVGYFDRCLRCFARQLPDFISYYCKPSAVLSGPGSFYRGI
jgi:hypothetical protein